MAKNSLAIVISFSLLLASGLGGAIGSDPTLPDYMRSGTSNKYINKNSLKRTDFKLSMIVHDETRKMAIINNKIKLEKEYIAGAKILKIKENSVVLQKSGERLELNLIKGNRRK